MKFSADIFDAIKAAERASGSRGALCSVRYDLTELDADQLQQKLRIRAYSDTHALEVSIPATVDQEGTALVESSLLRRILQGDKGTFSAQRTGKMVQITSGPMSLRLAAIEGYHGARDRLDKEWGPAVTLDGDRLAKGLKAAVPYAGGKGVREVLKGVYLSVHQGQSLLLAADGRSLCEVSVGAVCGHAPFDQFMIPTKTATIIADMVRPGPLFLKTQGDNALFESVGSARISVSVITQGYDLRKFAKAAWQPQDEPLLLVRRTLVKALKKCLVILKGEIASIEDDFVPCRVTLHGETLTLRARQTQLSFQLEVIRGAFPDPVNVNPNYLLAALSGDKGDNVPLYLSDKGILLVESKGARFVIVPMG